MKTEIKVFKVIAFGDEGLAEKLNEIEKYGAILAVLDNKGGDWKVIARCAINEPESAHH